MLPLLLSLSTLTDVSKSNNLYIVFHTMYIILIMCVILMMKNISITLKITYIAVIYYIFRRNINILLQAIYLIYNYKRKYPVNARVDDRILRGFVSSIFTTNFRLVKEDFYKLPSTPSIFVCNYCSDRYENFACILIERNIAIVMRKTTETVNIFGVIKWPIYALERDNFNMVKNAIDEHIKKDISVLAYVTLSPVYSPTFIRKPRSGMFKIAKELNIPITPVTIDYIDTNFGSIPYQNFRIKIGETSYVDDVNKSISQTRLFFKKSMIHFKKNKYQYL
jgi:hypothetical protein